jgi:hypothetical protein
MKSLFFSHIHYDLILAYLIPFYKNNFLLNQTTAFSNDIVNKRTLNINRIGKLSTKTSILPSNGMFLYNAFFFDKHINTNKNFLKTKKKTLHNIKY